MCPAKQSIAFDCGSCIFRWLHGALALWFACYAGCGSTKSYTATDQLLISDAVDATVAQLDFSPLTERKVYLDTTYLKTQKSPLLIDSDYVISSLRQQMVHAGVFLVEGRDEADIIAEARIGALGLDSHSVTYGVPANNTLSTATSVFTSSPILPSLPEMSLARHEAKSGAAKIAVFAYERETRLPYWQSGIAKSSSSARDTWLLGAGPWQRGTIYDAPRFAGTKIEGGNLLTSKKKFTEEEFRKSDAFHEYRSTHLYDAAKEDEALQESEETEIAEGEESVILTGAERPAEDS